MWQGVEIGITNLPWPHHPDDPGRGDEGRISKRPGATVGRVLVKLSASYSVGELKMEWSVGVPFGVTEKTTFELPIIG